MTLAIDSFDRACAMKLAPSCTMAGLAKLDDANGSEGLMAAARDLAAGCLAGSDFACAKMGVALGQAFPGVASAEGFAAIALRQMGEDCRVTPNDTACYDRSEEHTSELQSLMRTSYAVFCLKNKTTK